MNKYVLKTSLVWIAILAFLVGVWFLRFRGPVLPPAETVHTTEVVQPPASTSFPEVKIGDSSATEQNLGTPLAAIQLTPERTQSIGVTIGSAEYKQLTDEIRATGSVEINERLVSYVQVRFPGYIRKVFANASYQYVRKGEPLFTIYSPELVATEQDFLLALQNQKGLSTSTIDGVASGAASLSAAAEQRLQQWEIAPSEMTKLKETGKPIADLTVYSPVSGYITERNALPNMYVEPSTRLYTVADLSRVWVYAQVFQGDLGRIRPGDNAEITADTYPGKKFSAQIEDIVPQIDMSTRTARVRLSIANPNLKLKPGMFVNVDLKTALGRQLVVPATAVLQSGTRQMVFLNHGNGRLEPREILIGSRIGDEFVVLKGLKPHQSIVTSANFLIDSESQLQAAAGAFVPPPPGVANTVQPGNEPVQAKISFTTNPDPPQKGSNIFRVKLTGANGGGISGAAVTVTFYMAAMPSMGMAAMNTTSTLTDRGAGLYEGMGSLGSGGTWKVTVSAQKGGQVIATQEISLNATGGM